LVKASNLVNLARCFLAVANLPANLHEVLQADFTSRPKILGILSKGPSEPLFFAQGANISRRGQAFLGVSPEIGNAKEEVEFAHRDLAKS
jgi:hypothetical protein